jgi:hypothetical protein
MTCSINTSIYFPRNKIFMRIFLCYKTIKNYSKSGSPKDGKSSVAVYRARDFKRFLQLRKEDLYIWCAKIYYGLIYHETKLCDWRTADASFSPSLPNAILRELSFLLDLLQGFRKRVLVSGPRKLFSLLSFPLHADGDPADTFHPAIQVQFPCIALRLGSVGVLCVLDDFGTTENAYAQIFEPALRGKTLDPIQFGELVGRLSFLSWNMPFEVTVGRIEGKRDMMLDYSVRSLGDQMPDPKAEAEWISELTGLPVEDFYANGGARSLLLRPDRTFNELSRGGDPPPEK